jgi:hypothetical protein
MSLARRCCGPPDWARSGEAVGPLSIRRCPAAAVVLAGGHVLDDGELELGTATPDALAPLLRLQLQRPRDQLDAQRAVLEHESAQVLIAAQEDKAGEIAEVELASSTPVASAGPTSTRRNSSANAETGQSPT